MQRKITSAVKSKLIGTVEKWMNLKIIIFDGKETKHTDKHTDKHIDTKTIP